MRLLSFLLPCLAVSQRLPNMTVANYIDDFNSEYNYKVRVEKFNLMAQSSFGFFRGSNHLWLLDTLASPSRNRFGAAKSILQGDAHVYNVGSYDSALGNESAIKGQIVYNLNDYDEAFYGDVQIDVWREAVSLILTIRSNGIVDPLLERTITFRFAKSYAESVLALDSRDGTIPLIRDVTTCAGNLQLFMHDLQARNRSQMLELYIRKNEFDTTKRTLATPSTKEESMIKAQIGPISVTVAPELCSDASACARFLSIKSIARREETGIGSYGVKRFFVLIEGKDKGKDDDYILDIKEQPWPTAFSFFNATDKAAFLEFYKGIDNATRVINAEAAIGAHKIPKILGTIQMGDKSFSVRDRSPWKGTFPALLKDAGLSDVDFPSASVAWALGSKNDTQQHLELMIDQWAEVLAVAHYQGGKKYGFSSTFRALMTDPEDNSTTAQVEAFAEIAKNYAENYAAQVDSDYAAFRAWGACVSNVCLWPPFPDPPGTQTNYLIYIAFAAGFLIVFGLAWWYLARKRARLHAATHTVNWGDWDDADTGPEPVWSGHHSIPKPKPDSKLPKPKHDSKIKAVKIDTAEIEEYAQLDALEGHNEYR